MDKLKTPLIVVIAVVICGAGIYALYAWPEYAPVKGGRELLQAIRKASDLHKAALSSLESSAMDVVRVSRDKEGRLIFNEGDIVLRGAMELDAKALLILDKGQKLLQTAIAEHGDADAETLALANATQGRIEALRGKYYAAVAARAWYQARAARRGAYPRVAQMGSEGIKARYFARLAALPTTQAEALVTQLKADRETLQTKIAANQTAIQEKEKARTELVDAGQKLATQIQKLMTESQLAPTAKEGKQKFEEAETLDKQRRQDVLKIDKIENEIADLKAERADLDVQVKSVEARIVAGQQVLDTRKKLREGDDSGKGYLEILKAEKDKLSKSKAGIEALAKEALEACQRSEAACKEAQDAYGAAIQSHDKAAGLIDRQDRRKAEYLAPKGDILMAWGDLYTGRLANQQENEVCVRDIERLWVDPADLDAVAAGGARTATLPKILLDLRGFLTQAGQVRATTEAKYKAAAEAYAAAVQSLPDKRLAWGYLGDEAAAYLKLWELSGHNDSGSLSQARKLLTEATAGQELSPFVKPLVDELKALPQQ